MRQRCKDIAGVEGGVSSLKQVSLTPFSSRPLFPEAPLALFFHVRPRAAFAAFAACRSQVLASLSSAEAKAWHSSTVFLRPLSSSSSLTPLPPLHCGPTRKSRTMDAECGAQDDCYDLVHLVCTGKTRREERRKQGGEAGDVTRGTVGESAPLFSLAGGCLFEAAACGRGGAVS